MYSQTSSWAGKEYNSEQAGVRTQRGLKTEANWRGIPLFLLKNNLRAKPNILANLIHTLGLWYAGSDLGGLYGGLVAKSCPTPMNSWTTAHQFPLSIGFPRQAY